MNSVIKKEMRQYAKFLKVANVKKQLEDVIDSVLSPSGPSGTTPKAPVATSPSRAKTKEAPADRVTSPYGKRKDPISGKIRFHSGIDLAAPVGAEIKSWESGKVVKTGSDSLSGNFVIIRHEDGFTTSYSHLSNILVEKGSSVYKDQVIGLAGKTGKATGPHLHFRMSYKGEHMDPAPYLAGRSLVGSVRN